MPDVWLDAKQSDCFLVDILLLVHYQHRLVHKRYANRKTSHHFRLKIKTEASHEQIISLCYLKCLPFILILLGWQTSLHRLMVICHCSLYPYGHLQQKGHFNKFPYAKRLQAPVTLLTKRT